MAAASRMAYWRVALVYAAAGAFSSFTFLWLLESSDHISIWAKDPLIYLLCSGVATISAVAASLLLRPLFRRLAAHRYFRRPIALGLSVTIVAYLLFVPIAVLSFEVRLALTQEHYHFETLGFLGTTVSMGYFGFIFTSFITLPLGVLAAYCVEILDWFCGDSQKAATEESGA